MEIIFVPKNAEFYCEKCDFKCIKNSNWVSHLKTKKHVHRVNGNKMEIMEIKKEPIHKCSCGKAYKTNSGLWKHEKVCEKKMPISCHPIYAEDASKNIIFELIKQNQDFKDLLIEQNKQIIEQNRHILDLSSKIGSNNNTNCNNNTTNNFNLQFFLNEQCKDALNITDFINQLQLKLTDLDMVGRIGYSEGISKIFIRGLKELDICKRPIHCSDLKREVMYVKDKDSWEKDNDDKKKMKTAIKYIAAKNFKQIQEWREENPESDDIDSKKHMEYHNIIINATGGATPEEDETNYNKIIKCVAKESIIDKIYCKPLIE